MRVLILGLGNLLCSDEGFGVHCLRYLQQHYLFPPEVKLLDAGTLGLSIASELEQADRIYLLDAIDVPGEPGSLRRFAKDAIVSRLLIKVSPHQAGIQEAIAIAELRGRCPASIELIGVIPVCLAPGTDLSACVAARVAEAAQQVAQELEPSLKSH
jgi:hydrogenase maturation protease